MCVMSDAAFHDELTQRLAEYGDDLVRTSLPTLKTGLTGLRLNVEGLISLLKKKGLLADDPYQFADKVSEIKPVPAEPFLENQKSTVLSIRFHHFETQLAFLTDTYQISLEFLSLGQLRLLTQLLRYVRWDSLSENHQESNTKLMAELLGRARKGEDSISAGLVNDMAHQLAVHCTQCFDAIKRVTVYKREEYKAQIRGTFWEGLNLAPEEVVGNQENVQQKIRRAFANHMKGYPYIPELIKELLEEDFAPNGASLREEVLVRLSVTKANKEKPKVDIDPRAELMEAVRVLGSASVPLDTALRKLHDSAALLEEGPLSLGERFAAWIRKLMGMKTAPRVIQIELFDPASGATKKETMDFDAFHVEALNRNRVLGSVSNRNGPQFIALGQKTEEDILAWFERQFLELAKTTERCNGLDLYFKTEVPKEKKTMVKGVKAEVAQIRTSMGNANKKRHEALARKEEQEQLKRLGIR